MIGPAPAQGTFRVRVRVQPGAARTEIVGRHGDAIKVRVAAPPARGAANAALTDALAAALGVPRRAVRVVQGQASRAKVVEVACVDVARCRARLDGVVDAAVDKSEGGG
ncbi:DUF167 domain-containing protein [Candidatus Binatia bacterium]|nr:DUF167 domain-containing protein [Candidatus Binatia bacterium]